MGSCKYLCKMGREIKNRRRIKNEKAAAMATRQLRRAKSIWGPRQDERGAKMGENGRGRDVYEKIKRTAFPLCILSVTPKFLMLTTPLLSTKIIYAQLQSDPAPSSTGPHRRLKSNAVRLSPCLCDKQKDFNLADNPFVNMPWDGIFRFFFLKPKTFITHKLN